ncbi:ABC transporter permease [Paenarthrobacter sp. RAF54_2]|uniref:ABC transporter permease n=1 Tax=Paenarthrobacter sp. RAF54_2 TaxID=3233061 RepID=UPI003F99E3CC
MSVSDIQVSDHGTAGPGPGVPFAPGASQKPRFRVRPVHLWTLGVVLFVVFVGLLVLRPIYFIVDRSALNNGFTTAFTDPFIWQAIGTTIVLTVGAVVLALVVGTALAWFSLRLPRGLGWMSALPVMSILMPSVASITGWIFLFSPRVGFANTVLRTLPWWSDQTSGPIDVYTTPWIILCTGLQIAAFVYLFMSSGFTAVNSDLIEAAEVAGSSKLGVFFRVTLPLVRPSLVYATATAILLALGQFTAPLLLGRNSNIQVLTTRIFTYLNSSPVDFNAAAALGVPLVVIGMIIVFGQRALLGNQSRFVTHGGKGFKAVGRPSWSGVVWIGAYALLTAVLPLLAIIIVAVSPRWSADIVPSTFTLQHFSEALNSPEILSSVQNSVLFSLTSILIVIPIGFLCSAILVYGRRFKLCQIVLDFVVAMPLGMPALIFGLGFILAYSGPPINLYGTSSVVIAVYVTLMIPFSVRLQSAAMLSLGKQYIEASQVAGANLWRTTLNVLLPLMRSAFGAAAALIFLLLSHEFAASMLVRAPTTQVMGTTLYDLLEFGSYSEVAVLALIMAAVSLVGLGLAFLLGGRGALKGL